MKGLEKYLGLRGQMKTGDIVAFSGKGRASEIIKRFTKSEISHVGLVLVAVPSGLRDRNFIMESTTLSNLPDAIHGEFVKGLQCHLLSKRLESYHGKAWLYPLVSSVMPEHLTRAMEWAFEKHNARTKYDTFQAMGAGIDFWDKIFENKPDYSQLFCSEFVARWEQLAGKFSNILNPSEMNPYQVCNQPAVGKPTLILES